MFVGVEHIRNGIMNFAFEKIMPSLEPHQQFMAGTVLGVFAGKANELIAYIATQPIIKALGVVDGNNIDVDVLYNAATEQIKRQGTVCFDIPLIGRLTLEQGDIHELYESIKRG